MTLRYTVDNKVHPVFTASKVVGSVKESDEKVQRLKNNSVIGYSNFILYDTVNSIIKRY